MPQLRLDGPPATRSSSCAGRRRRPSSCGAPRELLTALHALLVLGAVGLRLGDALLLIFGDRRQWNQDAPPLPDRQNLAATDQGFRVGDADAQNTGTLFN